jgi:hypothetical protein
VYCQTNYCAKLFGIVQKRLIIKAIVSSQQKRGNAN